MHRLGLCRKRLYEYIRRAYNYRGTVLIKMKILAVLTYYRPHWTGLTAYAVSMAEGLAARGHAVTVLTSQYQPDLPSDENINGVHVIRLRSVARLSRGVVTPALPYTVARLIRQHDLVQMHTPLPEAPLVAFLCRVLNRPVVMTHHGDLVMPEGLVNQILERVGFALLYTAAFLANGITSHSRGYAENSHLLRGFMRKQACIYPPVEVPQPDMASALAWRHELGHGEKLLLGFAGRWVSEKGFDYLIEALPLVRQTFPQAHLVFAGERRVVYEKFYDQCLPLVEANREHITFLGLIHDRQKMADFHGMCDLFVLPSRTDMMPSIQIEALLCGTPVVASDIPGARDVLRATGFGLLARPHDPQGLASAIVEALHSREALHPTRAAVRETFDSEKTITQYESFMERLVAREKPVVPDDRFQPASPP